MYSSSKYNINQNRATRTGLGGNLGSSSGTGHYPSATTNYGRTGGLNATSGVNRGYGSRAVEEKKSSVRERSTLGSTAARLTQKATPVSSHITGSTTPTLNGTRTS